MGFFADLYIALFIRFVARLVRNHKSRNWPTVAATISSTDSERIGFGCPCSQVNPTYSVAGETYTGFHVRGFIFRDSAEEYGNGFMNRGRAVVRIKPGNPECSVLRDDDQKDILLPTLRQV